jgi:hypothetical protein
MDHTEDIANLRRRFHERVNRIARANIHRRRRYGKAGIGQRLCRSLRIFLTNIGQ